MAQLPTQWTSEDVVRVAKEMFEDGTTDSERYSRREWISRGWPEVDNEDIHRVVSHYLKYLRAMEKYAGRELPEYRREALVKKSDRWPKKT